jgi:hypothetical protein
MTKTMLTEQLTQKHQAFVADMMALTPEAYAFRYEDKWTAGQQLEHILLCVKPLVQVYSMDTAMIAQTFGTTDRVGLTYDELLAAYLEKLNAGGKAPSRFVPESSLATQQALLGDMLTNLVSTLCEKVNTLSDEALDTLQIPHPLLGNLTLREMLYNAIYHVQHHHLIAKERLQHFS